MTGFDTHTNIADGEFIIKFYTTDKAKFDFVQEACRRMVDHKKITEGDRIRKMGDRQLALFLMWLNDDEAQIPFESYTPPRRDFDEWFDHVVEEAKDDE